MKTFTIKAKVHEEDYAKLMAARKIGRDDITMIQDILCNINEVINFGDEDDDELLAFHKEYNRIMSRLTKKNK